MKVIVTTVVYTVFLNDKNFHFWVQLQCKLYSSILNCLEEMIKIFPQKLIPLDFS